MVDGKGNRSGGCDITRIGDLLEVGLDRNGHGEKEVVDHIEDGRQFGLFDEGIRGENHDQTDVFDR